MKDMSWLVISSKDSYCVVATILVELKSEWLKLKSETGSLKSEFSHCIAHMSERHADESTAALM